MSTRMNLRVVFAAGASMIALFVSDTPSIVTGTFSTAAYAVRGRPATPLSYAGVARRTTRRAVAVGAAASSGCVQAVDAYGRVITRCY